MLRIKILQKRFSWVFNMATTRWIFGKDSKTLKMRTFLEDDFSKGYWVSLDPSPLTTIRYSFCFPNKIWLNLI